MNESSQENSADERSVQRAGEDSAGGDPEFGSGDTGGESEASVDLREAESARQPSNSESSQTATSKEEKPKTRRSPATHLTRGVFLAVAVLFIWHLFADRITPYTASAHVQAFVLPVASQVSGYVVDVPVALNQEVERGDVLFQIDPEPYRLAAARAEAQLATVGQNLRAGGANIDATTSALAAAKTQLENSQRNLERVEKIRSENPGAVSQLDIDAYLASRDNARAQVSRAQANTAQAKEQLGVEGDDNPAVLEAQAQLDTARFNLERTTVRAPRSGSVVDLRLTEGQFASPGQPLATVLVHKDTWLRAPMRENNLVFMRPGARAEIMLDSAPGRVFSATVQSIGQGAAANPETPVGALPNESQSEAWFSSPQLFPVVLRVSEEVPPEVLRVGGKGSVVVYTGDHSFLNEIAKLHIRLVSYVAYLN